jgi:ATP-dependent Clp protease ATP-binding subunit ClpA
LVAIFSEKESHSVYILNKSNINRLDVVTFISHGSAERNEGLRINSDWF